MLPISLVVPTGIGLIVTVFVVFAFVGLCWYLLSTVTMPVQMKVTMNVCLAVGLILFLAVWVLPRVLALVGN